jgi:hypothetical protein
MFHVKHPNQAERDKKPARHQGRLSYDIEKDHERRGRAQNQGLSI